MKRRKFIRDTSLAGLSIGLVGACASMDKKDCEVLIIGAGLSGLYAARLLEKAGVDYKIIEGSDRIGGRLFSKNIEGTIVDWGGVEVGDGYKRLLGVASALNVPTHAATRSKADWLLHYKGENVVSSKWADAKMNPLSGGLKNLPPYLLESSPLRGKIPFESLDGWFDTKHQGLDISHAAYLKEQAGYTAAELELIDHAANHNGVNDISALHNMRSSVYRQFGGSKGTVHFTNGSQSLTDAMADSLTNPPELKKKVTSINDQGDSVRVSCADGSSYTASRVICTIPFSVLKEVKMDVAMDDRQAKAIQELDYTQITQVAFIAKSKYWEEDGLPLSMWTDTPIERVFAANSKDDLPKVFKVFINGQGAKDFDKMKFPDQVNLIKSTLAKIRPSTEGNIDIVDMQSWGNYEFNRGAYAEFHAGQVRAFVPHMIKPAGNIHFAGEHTGLRDKGMEAAMESGQRAAEEIITIRKTA